MSTYINYVYYVYNISFGMNDSKILMSLIAVIICPLCDSYERFNAIVMLIKVLYGFAIYLIIRELFFDGDYCAKKCI